MTERRRLWRLIALIILVVIGALGVWAYIHTQSLCCVHPGYGP